MNPSVHLNAIIASWARHPDAAAMEANLRMAFDLGREDRDAEQGRLKRLLHDADVLLLLKDQVINKIEAAKDAAVAAWLAKRDDPVTVEQLPS